MVHHLDGVGKLLASIDLHLVGRLGHLQVSIVDDRHLNRGGLADHVGHREQIRLVPELVAIRCIGAHQEGEIDLALGVRLDVSQVAEHLSMRGIIEALPLTQSDLKVDEGEHLIIERVDDGHTMGHRRAVVRYDDGVLDRLAGHGHPERGPLEQFKDGGVVDHEHCRVVVAADIRIEHVARHSDIVGQVLASQRGVVRIVCPDQQDDVDLPALARLEAAHRDDHRRVRVARHAGGIVARWHRLEHRHVRRQEILDDHVLGRRGAMVDHLDAEANLCARDPGPFAQWRLVDRQVGHRHHRGQHRGAVVVCVRVWRVAGGAGQVVDRHLFVGCDGDPDLGTLAGRMHRQVTDDLAAVHPAVIVLAYDDRITEQAIGEDVVGHDDIASVRQPQVVDKDRVLELLAGSHRLVGCADLDQPEIGLLVHKGLMDGLALLIERAIAHHAGGAV